MQVGDLVTCQGRLLLDGHDVEWIGLIVERAQPDRWMVLWNDGKTENNPENILEILCK